MHPQKTEVRFGRPREVHEAVREALGSALGHEAAVPSYGELRPAGEVASPVAAAALRGRLYRFDLKARPRSAKLLDLPLPLPWAVIHQPDKEKSVQPEGKAPTVPGEEKK